MPYERVVNPAVFPAAMPPAMREYAVPREMIELVHRSVTWVYGHLHYYGPSRTAARLYIGPVRTYQYGRILPSIRRPLSCCVRLPLTVATRFYAGAI